MFSRGYRPSIRIGKRGRARLYSIWRGLGFFRATARLPNILARYGISHSRSARGEQRQTRRTDSNDDAAVHVLFSDEPAFVRLFPNRKAWARRPPRIHHLFVAPVGAREPLQKIERQRFDGVKHFFFLYFAFQ